MRGNDPIIPFEWYTLEVERRLRDAKMIIDGKEVVKGKSPGSTRGLNIRMDVYFGGFDGERIFNTRKWWISRLSGDKSTKDYWASQQVIGRDFSENYPGEATLALAVGSRAGWLGYEGSSKSKHTKALPTSC